MSPMTYKALHPHEVKIGERWFIIQPPESLIGDKAYDGDLIDIPLARFMGSKWLLHIKTNRKTFITIDARALKYCRHS